MSILQQSVTTALDLARKLSKASPRATAYVYDLINRRVFTDLYWHERMLADKVRIEAYQKGIQATIKPGDVVIDLGTGSGILAFMAARSGAKHVYAIDHSDFIEIAREIAARNGFENITFVSQNSRDFVPPEPADILLHEQLGHAIFGENMVMNLLDLKRRALKPTGRIIPGAFELFIEPVSLKDEYRIPAIWEMDHLGLKLEFLRDYPPLQKYMGRNHRIRQVKNFEVEQLLCDPAPLFSFDMNDISSEDDIRRRYELSRPLVKSGVLDGFCVYFRGSFDAATSFETAPSCRQTNWDNLLIRTPKRQCRAGDQLNYSLELGDLEKPRTWEITFS